MPNMHLGAFINHYLVHFLFFVLVILALAPSIYDLILFLKSSGDDEKNELFPSDESKVRDYYKQYFSDSETPFYLVDSIMV